MPASDRLTRSTCAAWSSIDRLRWRIPTPPWRAIAIAIRASVTVSIADDTSGTRIRRLRVSWVEVSTWLGLTSDSAGRRRTSSNVSPTRANGSAAAKSMAHRTCRPPSLPSAHEAPAEAHSDRVRAIGGAQLAEQPARVGLDGVLRQVQLAADLGVAAAAG